MTSTIKKLIRQQKVKALSMRGKGTAKEISNKMLTKQQEVNALYMSGQATVREISKITYVSETTINNWINNYNWQSKQII